MVGLGRSCGRGSEATAAIELGLQGRNEITRTEVNDRALAKPLVVGEDAKRS